MSMTSEWIGQAAAAVSLASTVPRLLRGPITRVAAWRERRAVIDWLAGMPDRELADIGLDRAQIHKVFDPAFARARDAQFRATNTLDERVLADLGLSRTLSRPTAGD